MNKKQRKLIEDKLTELKETRDYLDSAICKLELKLNPLKIHNQWCSDCLDPVDEETGECLNCGKQN